MAAKIPSLEEFSEGAVIASLGKLAKSVECRFACGGTLPQVESVDLVYRKQSGDWKSLQLPAGLASASESFQEFLDSCSAASFGIGGETVTDKEYRDALKLPPNCFRADFEVANTSIIDHITRIMSIGSSIRAELYMLNVYSTGGHFKSHVDTPRSQDMFGSLVVCLPSQFTGGALVTRHQGRQVTFDWSSSIATRWAAFFGNVEHEVLPVTSGHRITLTYNLYHVSPIKGIMGITWNDVLGNTSGLTMDGERLAAELKETVELHVYAVKYKTLLQKLMLKEAVKQIMGIEDKVKLEEQASELLPRISEAIELSIKQNAEKFIYNPKLLDVTTNPLYQELLASLQNPHFMRGGGTLGFYCQHKYTNLSTDLDTFSAFLKGEDAVVYCIAKSLDLSITLKPILLGDLCGRLHVLSEFKSHDIDVYGYEDNEEEWMKETFDILENTVISWCQKRELDEPILSTVHYGNQATANVFYQSAAFLISVPEFKSRCGTAVTPPNQTAKNEGDRSTPNSPPAKRSKADEGTTPETIHPV